MSQKKVDNYKAQKYGKAKESRKEKFYDWLERIVGVVVVVALVAWIGYSVYDKIEQKEAATITQTALNTTALDNYVSGLSPETDTDAADTTSTDADTADTTDANADAADTAETDTDANAADDTATTTPAATETPAAE